MIRTCSFVLDNGHRCHCAANRDQDYCRHHSPTALALRRAAQPGAPAPDAPFSPRREWGQLREYIGYCNEDSIPDLVDDLMICLFNGTMTPRTAGRFLLLIYNRREQIRRQQLPGAFQAQSDVLAQLTAVAQASQRQAPAEEACRK